MEDKLIQKALSAFYSDPAGWTTDEIYSQYVDVCESEGIRPRAKSVVIREICKQYGCKVEEKVKVVRVKTFRRAGFNG